MPRRRRASSSNRRPQSRAVERKRAPVSPPQQLPEPSRAAEWEQAVRAGDREKIAALSRRSPDDPPDKFVPIDDLIEGAPITGQAAAARPALTVWWSEEQLPEDMAIMVRALHHFGINRQTNTYVGKRELVEYLRRQRRADGSRLSGREVFYYAHACRAPEDALPNHPRRRTK
jgi:hypothetical protein